MHQVAKDKIRKLEAEIKELKLQNEVLRGHVAEIYEIRDENERLRTQLRELTSSNSSSKIIPIRSSQASSVNLSETNLQAKTEKEKTSDKATPKKVNKGKRASFNNKEITKDIEVEVINSIKEMGLKVGTKLKREIANRDPKQVKLSIAAFKQYRVNHDVKSQEACLLSMICDEAEPNTESTTKASIRPQEKAITAKDNSGQEIN